eukprot:3427633-Rhodomonas_salina.1
MQNVDPSEGRNPTQHTFQRCGRGQHTCSPSKHIDLATGLCHSKVRPRGSSDVVHMKVAETRGAVCRPPHTVDNVNEDTEPRRMAEIQHSMRFRGGGGDNIPPSPPNT